MEYRYLKKSIRVTMTKENTHKLDHPTHSHSYYADDVMYLCNRNTNNLYKYNIVYNEKP